MVSVESRNGVEEQISSPEQPQSKVIDISSELADRGLDLNFLGEISESEKSGPNENNFSDNKASGRTKSTKAMTADEYALWRINLINSTPREKDMVRDIRSTLRVKLSILEKQEAVLKKKGLKKIMHYNDAVAKIRHLNRLLQEVATSSYQALKALWLRIVHGIV